MIPSLHGTRFCSHHLRHASSDRALGTARSNNFLESVLQPMTPGSNLSHSAMTILKTGLRPRDDTAARRYKKAIRISCNIPRRLSSNPA